MSMSGCQLCHGFIRWHQKLLFLNLSSAKSEQGTPHPRSETQHPAGDAETLEEKLLYEHQNSCLVPPLGEEEELCYTHLGLEHMEEEGQSLECAKWGKTYCTLWKYYRSLERTTVSKELRRWHVHQSRNMAKEFEKHIKRKVLPGLTRKQREQLCGLGPFTIFHSTANSEVQYLINLCFRVFSGVIPKPNP